MVGNQNEVSPITVAAVPRTKLPPPVAPKPKILQTDNLSQGQDRTERPSSMYSYSQPYKATYQHQTQEQRQKQLEREQRDEQYPQQQQNYEQRQNYFKKMPQPHQTQRQFGSSGAQNWSPPTVSPETALAKPQHGNVIHKVRTNSGSQQVARNNSSNRSSSQEPLSSNSKTLSPIEPKHGDAKENLKDFSFPILSYDDEEYEQISQKRVREMDRRMERVSMFSSVQNLDTSHSAINNNFEHTNTNSVFKNRPNEPRPVATQQHEQPQRQQERQQRDEQHHQKHQNYEQRQNYYKKMPQPHQTQQQFGSSGAQNWSPPTVSTETTLVQAQHGKVTHTQSVARNNSSNRSSSQEPLSSNSKTLSHIEPNHSEAKGNLPKFSIQSYDDEEYEQISQKRVREMDRRMERVSMFSSVQNLDTSHSAINNNFEHTNTNSVFKNRPNEPRPVATQQHEQPQRQQERQQRDEQHHQKHQNYEQRQNYYKKMPQPHQTQQQFGSSGAQNWSPPTVSTETTLVQAQHGKVTHTQSVARNNSSNRSSSQEPLSSNSKTLSHIEPNHSEAKGNLPKFSIQSYDDEEYEQISQKRVRDVDRRMERESMSASVQNLDISHSTINSNFNTINRNSDFDNRPQESQMSILRPRNKKMAKSATNLSQAQAGVTFKQRVKVKELDGGDERENTEEYFPLAIPAQPKQTKFDQFARRKSSGEVEAEIKPMNCMEDQSHLNDDEFKNILHSLCSNKDPKYRFKSMKKLGEGSTYTSYKAEDIFLKQTVSLKIMSIRKHARRELMFNEVLVLKEYQHPNIVGFFDSYLVGDNLWISSEYMRGGTLTSYITKRKIKFKEPQIVYIVQSLLKVLVFIHSKGIIHRDIKSDSVSLTEEGIVKLSDFGYCGQISQEYPKRRSLVGTPHWMAPEVALSRPYGTEADIWSLGILIIEIKEKQPPHFDQGLKQVMKTIADSPAPTFRDPKSASRMLIGFVAQCLEKNVLKRPSAKELLLHPLMCENLSSEVIDFVVTK